MFKKKRKENKEVLDLLNQVINEKEDNSELPYLYVSMEAALGLPCDLDTPGKYNVLRHVYTNDEDFKSNLRDSKKSPFGNYGIQENYYIERRPLALYRVANHVRVYLDMLYELRFDELEGMFYDYLATPKARRAIFEMTLLKCKNLARYSEIHKFLVSEFGNSYLSFLQGIHNNAKYLSDVQDICLKSEDGIKLDTRFNKFNTDGKFTLDSKILKEIRYE